ncbi:MAG TPA: GNAT family N-acetyltransferase [Gemmataceae bacterium]|nr:GNAT family N-acetyltransferase [Gemmataceae bacterium]
MPTIDVTVYYLEMLAHAKRAIAAPRDDLMIVHAHNPSVAYYRYLYHAVGADYHWRSRGLLSDAALAAILSDPGIEVHVLHVAGCPAGFAELDRRKSDDVELVQFGLMRDHIGKGLGKYFLQCVIDKVWSDRPRRFWLHTCTLDHPHALPNYEKSGFTLYKQEVIQRDVPRV